MEPMSRQKKKWLDDQTRKEQLDETGNSEKSTYFGFAWRRGKGKAFMPSEENSLALSNNSRSQFFLKTGDIVKSSSRFKRWVYPQGFLFDAKIGALL